MSCHHPPGNRNLSPLRIFLKGIGIFVFINILFALLNPPVGRISFYNRFLPGFVRFPEIDFMAEQVGGLEAVEDISVSNIDALFASHVISAQRKPADEYRVILLGDSSVWGALLKPAQTVSGRINAAQLKTCTGQRVVTYNLGHLPNAVTKDLVIMTEAMKYQPDLIVWFISLYAFHPDRQCNFIVTDNADRVHELMRAYDFHFDAGCLALHEHRQTLWSKTLIGQRRELKTLLLLQLYGVMAQVWGADDPRTLSTGDLTVRNPPKQSLVFQGYEPPLDLRGVLQLDVLRVSHELAGETPLVYVNEPIYINPAKDGDVRYNWLYPHWAYDQYRDILFEQSTREGWIYLDLWNLVPPEEFSDSVFHRSSEGEVRVAEKLVPFILREACNK